MMKTFVERGPVPSALSHIFPNTITMQVTTFRDDAFQEPSMTILLERVVQIGRLDLFPFEI
jgi:hypothetical protein